MVYNPDGTRLAVGDAGGEVQIWDTTRFRPIGEPMRHHGAIRHIAFSPDGSRLATASYDKTARLWDALTGAPIGAVLAHRAYVWCVRFSHDGERVVTASFDGTAQIWNGRTGAAMGEPLHHGELVYDAVWNDDSSRVLTYGRSESARLWDAASSRVLGELLSHGGRVDGAIFLPGRPRHRHVLARRDGQAMVGARHQHGARRATGPGSERDHRNGAGCRRSGAAARRLDLAIAARRARRAASERGALSEARSCSTGEIRPAYSKKVYKRLVPATLRGMRWDEEHGMADACPRHNGAGARRALSRRCSGQPERWATSRAVRGVGSRGRECI